jgi:hypothetical protein
MLTTTYTDVITAQMQNACLFNKYSFLFGFFVELLDHSDSFLQAQTFQRLTHIIKEKITYFGYIYHR